MEVEGECLMTEMVVLKEMYKASEQGGSEMNPKFIK